MKIDKLIINSPYAEPTQIWESAVSADIHIRAWLIG